MISGLVAVPCGELLASKAPHMTAIPDTTKRSRKLYRSRGAVEHEFGRLKHEWALAALRVRGIERVRLRAHLTILAKLG